MSQWRFEDCGVRVEFVNERDRCVQSCIFEEHALTAACARFVALATRPVSAGDPLVCVPHEALFTPAAARRCAACAAVAAAAPLSDWQVLSLALLHERSLGGASSWAPYVAVLPPQPQDDEDASAFLHPLLWPPGFTAQVLAGSPMLAKVQSRLATCAEDGATLRAAIAAAAAAAPGAKLPEPPSDADVRWAASVLLSRAFYLEDVPEHVDEADSDGDAGESADEDDDADVAPYSTLALVPWADRRVPRFGLFAASGMTRAALCTQLEPQLHGRRRGRAALRPRVALRGAARAQVLRGGRPGLRLVRRRAGAHRHAAGLRLCGAADGGG